MQVIFNDDTCGTFIIRNKNPYILMFIYFLLWGNLFSSSIQISNRHNNKTKCYQDFKIFESIDGILIIIPFFAMVEHDSVYYMNNHEGQNEFFVTQKAKSDFDKNG